MANRRILSNLLKHQKLSTGEKFVTWDLGKSMEPHLRHKQFHELAPVKWENCKPGDIVFCRVADRYYTHMVMKRDPDKGVLIANSRGQENGWTKEVFGKVIRIIPQYAE